ncbi:MAG: OmpA family protein [Cyclobacteriaceae bacterium]|nr:PD40 domain-containing protein [Cyclobacteriaceae bacterium]MCH8515929.1 OmpA family protein [Cyclobacteriaceae bacterium]
MKSSIKSYCLCLYFIFYPLATFAQTNISELPFFEKNIIDFAPSVSADGRTLIFESDRVDAKWRLFETAKHDDGTWSKPILIEEINKKAKGNSLIGGPSISYDGNVLYFFAYFEGESESEDIYKVVRTKEGWSEPIKLPATINSTGYEGFPSISADGNYLYFIRLNDDYPYDRKSKEDCFSIWRSRIDENGNYGKAIKLPAPINLNCERDPRILADGRTLIFSSVRENGKGKYDLYMSIEEQEGQWSEPKSLDFLNTKGNDLSVSMPASAELVYYYRDDRIYSAMVPEGYGGFTNIVFKGLLVDELDQTRITDARVFAYDDDDNQLAKQKVGANADFTFVFSPGSRYTLKLHSPLHPPKSYILDLTPFSSFVEIKDTLTLNNQVEAPIRFFDADLTQDRLYPSVRVNQSLICSETSESCDYRFTWGQSQTIFIDGLDEYENHQYSLNVKDWFEETGKYEFDIFIEAKKKSLKVNILDNISQEKIKNARIVLRNKNKDEVITAEDGEEVRLRIGNRYQLNIESERGYLFYSAELDVTEGMEGNLTFTMTPMVEGASLSTNLIVFESNQASLNPKAEEELNRIYRMLLNNPDVTVEIGAHTDDVGSDEFNLTLSEKRAQSVIDFLVGQGLPETQMIAKGYGESRLLFKGDSEEERALNRRVEITITKTEVE